VKSSLWKRLWTCRKTDYMNDVCMCIYVYIEVNGRLIRLVTFCVETAIYNGLLKER